MTDRKENRKHLYYLNELSDFKVDSDDPDVRGWTVKDVDNRTVGKVDNLLVSKEKKRVLYLDIEVDKSIIDANHDPYGKSSSEVHEFINKDGENHLILPIGMAKLNVDEKYVYSDKLNHQTFAETKRMEKGYDVDRDYEVVVLESYNRDYDRDRGDYNKDRNVGTGRTDSDITGSHTGRTETTLDEERRRMQQADRNRDRDLDSGDSERIAGRTGDPDRDITDRDKHMTDRDRDRTDRDKSFTDRDTGGVNRDRDSLTGRESGTHSGRNTGRIADNDSFYDRGEFESERFRNRDRDRNS